MTARAAAQRLRTALDTHLAAVEGRAGEHDPAVQRAYRELRVAAADYDEALYREHDEVTPFDLPDPPVEDDGDEIDPADVARLSVLARWDYSVTDRARMTATASEVLGQELPEAGLALAGLIASHGHARLAGAAAAASVGLRYHGTTTWITATVDADPGDDDPQWMDDAFDAADPEFVLCRLDGPVDPEPPREQP